MAARASFDMDEMPGISPAGRRAVGQAFEGFEDGARNDQIVVPRREHLGAEWREGTCCSHRWQPMAPTDENLGRLRAVFEEQDLGSAQASCPRCGAVALFEAQDRRGLLPPKLVAYDATARFGLPPEQRKEPARARQPQRSRR